MRILAAYNKRTKCILNEEKYAQAALADDIECSLTIHPQQTKYENSTHNKFD